MLGLVLGLSTQPARADLPPFFEMDAVPQAAQLGVGAIVIDDARYVGADERHARAYPTASYYHPSGFFADAISGVGVNFSHSTSFDAGVRATLDFGRDEPPALHGMGKINASLDPGLFYNLNVNEAVQLQSTLRYGLGYGHDGALFDVGASCVVWAHGKSGIALDTSASYANGAYMRSYYGVSAAQSVASGYAPYDPQAGWHLWRAGVSGLAQLNAAWSLYGGIERVELIGDAKHSPYVQRRTDPTVYFGFNYEIR